MAQECRLTFFCLYALSMRGVDLASLNSIDRFDVHRYIYLF